MDTIQVIIWDQSLPLAEIEAFATESSVRYATPVDIRWAWGGPAAGGMGWGPPEIALMIVGAEVLRRVSGDGYDLLKRWASDAITKIRTRNGARYYLVGAMGIEFSSDLSPVRIVLCAPEGTTSRELRTVWDRMDADVESLRKLYESPAPVAVYVWWDAQTEDWKRVDRPPPPDVKPLLR